MDAIAFLGSGSMAGAMVEGMIAKGTYLPAGMACIGGSGRSAQELAARTGIRLAASLEDLLGGAGTLVVAFKPQHLAAADARLAALTEGRLVVSVLAGKTMDALSRVFPGARNIVRSMPNTPSQIGAGITGWCARGPLAPADRALIEGIFGALGSAVELPEDKMDAFTAICGCGPAYVFEFAAALRDAGLGLGFDPATSKQFAVETVLGAGMLLARRGVDPEILRSEVTSPNGVTAAGLRRMADLDFRGMIKGAITAARARAQELSA
ncbi:MAG TPA: pyrroline-5-carboxylate reductase [Opitutaceae bacterium]|jgi:pyrroline-5-carboxylate reductase